MSDVEFVDTNVLVYARDRHAGDKRISARRLIADLWRSGRAAVSTQVLSEFYVVLTRKVASPVPPDEVRRRVARYARWNVVRPTASDVLAAIDLAQARTLHFWDALLVIAAQRAGASVLWTEDMQHGARFGDVEIRNPFLGRMPTVHEGPAEYGRPEPRRRGA